MRCESCDRGLAGSWSKGRSEYYAYYHCRPGCRAVNVTKAKLEGLFTDELALLRPIESGNEGLVDQNSASWNPVISWLRRIERLKFAE